MEAGASSLVGSLFLAPGRNPTEVLDARKPLQASVVFDDDHPHARLGAQGFTRRISTVLSVEEVTLLLRADRVTGGSPGDEVPLHRVHEIDSGTDRCRLFAGGS